MVKLVNLLIILEKYGWAYRSLIWHEVGDIVFVERIVQEGIHLVGLLGQYQWKSQREEANRW